jgi:iron complex outermembrane recepter protein
VKSSVFRAVLFCSASAIFLFGAASAQQRSFDIPADEAVKTIPLFARQAGIQIVASASQLDHVRTPAIHGEMDMHAALHKLIDATPLEIVTDNDGIITLRARTKTVEAQKAPATGEPIEEAPEKVVINGYQVKATAGGTRIATPLKELPMSVEVVNRNLIEDLGARKIEDAIRFVSGINKVNRNDNFGRGERFAIRGFNSSLIMRNGVPLNVLSDTSNIQQIDVVKGANSILYGFNDPGGLINYVTRKPQDTAAYSLSQTVGSFDYYRTEYDLTGPVASYGGVKLNYRLMGAYTDSGSWLENGMEKTNFINPVVDIHLWDATTLTVDYEYKRSNARFQRDSYPILYNGLTNSAGLRDDTLGYADAGARYSPIFPDDKNIDKVELLDIRLTHNFSDNVVLRLASTHSQGNVDHFNMIGYLTELNSDRMLKRRNLLEVAQQNTTFYFGDLTAKFSAPYSEHNLLVGSQYYRSTGDSMSVYGAYVPTQDILNPPSDPAVRYYRAETRDQLYAQGSFTRNHPTRSYGIFATDQIKLSDERTNILVGVRYDNVDNGSGAGEVTHYTPQAGASYLLFPELSVYALYSESFRLNPSTVLPNGNIISFPPEAGINREAGFKFELLEGGLSGTLALYQLDRSNVAQVTANGLDPNNPTISLSGRERSRGVELDVSGHVTEDLEIFGSYANANAEIVRSGNAGLNGAPLEGVSPNAFSLFARYNIGRFGPGDIQANAGVLWRDGPIYLANNSIASTGVVQKGYTAVDGGLDYRLNLYDAEWTLSLKATNLFDEKYMDRRSAYVAPRRIDLSLRVGL